MLNPCAISITVDRVTVLFIQENSGIVPGLCYNFFVGYTKKINIGGLCLGLIIFNLPKFKYLLKIFIKLIRNYEIYDIMHMKEI